MQNLMIAHQWMHKKPSPQVSGHQELACLMENIYSERPRDMECTIGWTNHTRVSYHELQEDVAFSSEADLQE